MWLFREHRGGLNESMKTCKSYDRLIDVIKEASKHSVYKKFDISNIHIDFYIIDFCTEKKL